LFSGEDHRDQHKKFDKKNSFQKVVGSWWIHPFVSLGEIFEESVNEFKKGLYGEDENQCNNMCKGNSKLLAMSCFIGGVIIIYLIGFIVHTISPDAHHELNIDELKNIRRPLPQSDLKYELDLVESQTLHRKKEHFNVKILKKK
jgi:hypothetical protein